MRTGPGVPCRWGQALAVGLVLSAGYCTPRPDEAAVRAHVARWLSPAATLTFSQTDSCTVAAFEARSSAVKSTLRIESDPQLALYHLKRTGVVGLSGAGMTPAMATEIIASSDFPTAVSVIRVGEAAQPCMSAIYQTAVYRAVHDPATLMILDARDISITVLDRSRRRIFFVKGAD